MQRLLPPDLKAYATAKVRIEYGKARELVIHTSKAESVSTHCPWDPRRWHAPRSCAVVNTLHMLSERRTARSSTLADLELMPLGPRGVLCRGILPHRGKSSLRLT